MEIKINKELRNYRETLFFGLSLRQFACSAIAVGTAVALYFALRNVLDKETVGWVCIVGASPIAAAGFFKYHGLPLEKFVWAFIKSEFLLAGHRVWRAENYYLSALRQDREGGKKKREKNQLQSKSGAGPVHDPAQRAEVHPHQADL